VFTANGALEEKHSWQYDPAGNMTSRTTEQGASKQVELRQHTGHDQLLSIGGAGRTLVEGTVDKPSTVTVSVGGAAAQPARVTSVSPTGPWQFQRDADFPVGGHHPDHHRHRWQRQRGHAELHRERQRHRDAQPWL